MYTQGIGSRLIPAYDRRRVFPHLDTAAAGWPGLTGEMMKALTELIDRMIRERDWLSTALYRDKHTPRKQFVDHRVVKCEDGSERKLSSSWQRDRVGRLVSRLRPIYGGGKFEAIKDTALRELVASGVPPIEAAKMMERAENAHAGIINNALEIVGDSANFTDGEVHGEHCNAIQSMCTLLDALGVQNQSVATTEADKPDTPKKISTPTGDNAAFITFLKRRLNGRDIKHGEMRGFIQEFKADNPNCLSDDDSLRRAAGRYKEQWKADT